MEFLKKRVAEFKKNYEVLYSYGITVSWNNIRR